MSIKDSNSRYQNWVSFMELNKGLKISHHTKMTIKQEYAKLAEIETRTRQLLSTTAIPTFLNFYYLAFAREIYGLTRRYQDTNLTREIDIVLYKWQSRGLMSQVLLQIKEQVLHVCGLGSSTAQKSPS
ncbi:MAG: hypothetical protein NZ601_02990 [candidate division WOR-3 bacterium]|nr:hypothetical protein [candidate division WOR-3 bacterium]MCX7756949.1 hypothetical protein [candidate division WOR-3 bacterium]MDW7987721.1 hypothetical protein [candidate division WOR-3 bacterium]